MLHSVATLVPKPLVRAAQSLRQSPSQWLAMAGAAMALAMPGAVLAQTISTVAGTGTAGYSGDGAPASAASVRFPAGAATDIAGNVYFADAANHRVRKIAVDGTITSLAGNGSMAYFGDGGPATSASLSFPSAVAVDAAGNVYIADTGNSRVRKVSATGTITTVAGNGTIGSSGDNGLATAASLYYPASVALDAAGNIYIADTFNHRVRVVAALTGVISTVAGTGSAGCAGDAGPASEARLFFPEGLALNSAGTLYVADTYNHRIRSVGGNTISTVGGNGVVGHVGDGKAATSASLYFPVSVVFDPGGNLYLADFGNNRIRVMPATGGLISAFAGAGSASSTGDGGPPTAATLNSPRGVASDGAGNVYISDSASHRIRKVGAPSTGSLTVVALNVLKSGSGALAGTVTSTNSSISCGETCFEIHPAGTVVTLSASATGGTTFSGWSGGGCSGTGTCTVTLSAATTVTAAFDGPPVSVRFVNVSTRGQALTGDGVMIGGFVISGSVPKKVLVTARGPSLAAFGVLGTLANPYLQIYSGQTQIASNDDWGSAGNAAEIQASGSAPGNALESAVLMTLNPGAYTAIVSGVSGGTGVGIVEAFEIDSPESPLINISTRGMVLTGDDVLIGGFVVQGNAPQTVLIRARGPSLTAFGVTGALSNPMVSLYSGQTLVASNDDWGNAGNVVDIQATGNAPTDSRESAILITLNPGAYTAIVSGAGGATGVGIVEFFAR